MPTIEIEVTDLTLALQERTKEVGGIRAASRALGVSPQTVANWCKGSPIPIEGRDRQYQLAGFLGVSAPHVLRLAGYEVDEDGSLPSGGMGGYLESVAA